MITTLNVTRTAQPAWGVQSSSVPIYTATGRKINVLAPTQIAGLIPLKCSTEDTRLPAFTKCDCREWTDDDCYINPVFASTSDTDVLKNDHNMFLLEYPFFYQYQHTNAALSQFSIEKYNGVTWNTSSTLTNDTYGIFYAFGDLGIYNWKGFDIDWRKILIAFDEGLYRFKVSSSIFGVSHTFVSEVFCLKEWSCKDTNYTVRWEAKIVGGRIGSITDDKRMFEFCCDPSVDADADGVPDQPTGKITWNDQVRVYGFFGKEKTEYERKNVEYRNGEIVQVSNEAINKFEYETALLPKYLHDRFKAYALMANELKVTDYNWNNADYEIQRKRVVCDGSYEPEYNENTRYSNVKVQFKEGFQNIIRDNCCSAPVRRGIR